MPRDFDAILTEDQEFIIGGQTFRWRYLHWSEFATAIDLEVAKSKEDPKAEADEENETVTESYEKVIERVCLYLEADDKERFLKLMHDSERPIPTIQLAELATWLVEVQTDLPTKPSSDSTAGRGRVVPISKAG